MVEVLAGESSGFFQLLHLSVLQHVTFPSSYVLSPILSLLDEETSVAELPSAPHPILAVTLLLLSAKYVSASARAHPPMNVAFSSFFVSIVCATFLKFDFETLTGTCTLIKGSVITAGICGDLVVFFIAVFWSRYNVTFDSTS